MSIKNAAVLAAALMACTLAGTPAVAGPDGSPATGITAQLDGRGIDLRHGWGEAQSCVVESKSTVSCFRDADAADTYLGYDKAKDPEIIKGSGYGIDVPACANGWFCLYEHIDGGGRRLIFRDDYWQDLGLYGFSRQTSSLRNTQAGADSGCLGGVGSAEPCWSSPSYVAWIGNYNDWAERVFA
jgi:hypothetical protein